MTSIEPRRISFGGDFKVGKTTNTPTPEKTIDLTLLSKEEDINAINKFITNIEKSDTQSTDIKSWSIKVSDQYIDLSANPREALKLMKDLKASIESGAKFKGDIKLNGANPQEVFFKEVKINAFSEKKLGEHDTDGYTLNPLDNTWMNVFTSDSDRTNDIVIGAPLNVFSSVTDAENFSKNRNGTEIILKNKESLYVVYDVKRKTNEKEYKSSDASQINAKDFTDNHSRFDKGFLNAVNSSKGFIITDDKKTLEIAGQTGVEVNKADYSVVKADMQLRMVDINGIQNTSGLHDWQGSLNGVVSIDIKAKMEETLNNLNLPTGTRVNVKYDEKDKSFLVNLNYEMLSERVGELTALKIKPNADGSLSINSFGILNANLNLTDGVAVNARVGIENYASVGANGSVSMKNLDQIATKAGVEMDIPLTTPLLPFSASSKVGAKVNPEMNRGVDNKYQVSPNLGNGNQNVFIPIQTKGVMVPGFVEKKTQEWENSAHKSIAGSIISIAEGMEKGGFILPKEIKDVKGRVKNWGTNKAQDQKDKQVINDFVNGKIKMEYDLSKQMNIKGFPNAAINKFDPNIKFNSDGQKLNIVFDNSTIIASSDGTAKQQATPEIPDGISANVSVNINNTTASLQADAQLQLHVDAKEKGSFSNKLTEMGINPGKAQISGDFTVNANLNSSLSDNTNLKKLDANTDIDMKANNVNITIPNSNTTISLRKASADGELKVEQDGKNTTLRADTKVSLSGFNVTQNNEKLVSLNSAAFSGKLSYKTIESVNENNQKTSKNQVIVQGHLDVSKGKYDNFNVSRLSADGLIAYTEKEGVSVKSSTTEAAIKLSGHISNAEEKIDLNIRNISGYGKVDLDANGNIKSANIEAGRSGRSEFKVSGKIGDQDFIIDSDIKLKGRVKIDQSGEKINLSLKGDVNRFKMGGVDLQDVKNINANIVYDPTNNSVTINAETGKNLDVKGKLNGKEFAFKGDASIKLEFNKETGDLTLIPSAKAEVLQLGSFSLNDAELKGTKIKLNTSNNNNKVILESIDGKDIEFKGNFVNHNKVTPVDVKGKGSIEINTDKVNSKDNYSVTANTDFERFQIGKAIFRNVSLEGKVNFDGQNISLSGIDNNSYLKLKGEQYNKTIDKQNNLEFEAKGNMTLIPDNKQGFTLDCKDIELKKAVINDYLIEDAKIDGKIVYAKDETERSISFSGDQANKNLELSGKLTKTYKEGEEEKKYVAKIDNMGIQGSLVFEDNKLKFTDIKNEVKGSINGVDVNNVIVTNTNPDGSTDISLSSNTDGLNFGNSLKMTSTDDGKVILTSRNEEGSLKMGFGKKDDVLKVLDDVVKINSISNSKQLVRDIDNIKKQLESFSSLNMMADLKDFNVVFDPKNKSLSLTSDLKGQIGTKILINDNKQEDHNNINLKSVDIEGKLTANTETNKLNIKDGTIKGTTDNIEEMVLDALSSMGQIPKGYSIDKENNKITLDQNGQKINIDMKKTGIGKDSRISMKTGTKVAGIKLNYNMASKITIENIAPPGQEPKNVLKIHLDKSNIGGIINKVDLEGKGKVLGFIPVNLNKHLPGDKTPYLDFVEPLDISKENTKQGYENIKKSEIESFRKTLPQGMPENQKERKINNHLKEKSLESFDQYQKHNGVVQLADERTITFDLAEYLSLKTGGNVTFNIEESENVLSGDANEDHFSLNFSVTVNDLGGNPAENIPTNGNTPTEIGKILDSIPGILSETGEIFDQVGKVNQGINNAGTQVTDQTKQQVNNTLNQMRNLNGQMKSNIRR